MFRLSTIRRRLLLGAGFVIVLSGLSLIVVHTGLVRRFALVQLQTRLGNTLGLVIDAKELDYNLLASRFELRGLVIRGVTTKDLPAPVKADRVVAIIPIWRLVQGSFETARIRIDGLSVDWLTTARGRSNWPGIETGDGGKGGGPSILVTSGSAILRNDRAGYRLQLPIGHVSASWSEAQSGYAILCDSARGELSWNGSRLPLDQLHVKSSVANGGVTLDSLHLLSGDSQVDITGALSGKQGRVGASATLDLNLRDLAALLLVEPPVAGRVKARVSATGLLDALEINADLQGEDVTVNRVPLVRPELSARYDTVTGEVRLGNLSAGILSGQLRANGRLSTTGGGPSAVEATLEGVNLRELAGVFGPAGVPNRRLSMDFRATSTGLDWRHATVTGTASAASARVSFRTEGTGDSLHASLDASAGDSSVMHGDLAFRPAGGAVTGEVSGKVESLARLGGELERLLDRPAGSLTAPAVDGTAQWSAVLSGTSHAPAASLQLQAEGLSVGGWSGAGLQLKAEYAQGRIAIENAHVAWGGQQVDLKGEIDGVSADSPLNLSGTVAGQSLARVFQNLNVAPPVEGAVSGEFQVTGNISHPQVRASLDAAEVSAFGQRFARTSLEAQWRDGQVVLSRFAAQQENEVPSPGVIEAKGNLHVATGQYEIDTAAHDLQLSEVPLSDNLLLSGTFQLKGHGKGTLSNPAWNLEVIGEEVQAGATSLGKVSVQTDAASHRATIQLAIPSLNIQAQSTVKMEGAWPFDLVLDAQKTRLATTPGATFDAKIQTSGTLRQPQMEKVSARIPNLKLETPGSDTVNDGPIELSYADGRVKVGRLALKSGESSLQVSGEMPLQEGEPAGAVSIQGTLDLISLAKLAPGLDESGISGMVDVNASIAGSANAWQPGGSLTLREGHLQLKGAPLSMDALAGHLTLGDGMVRLEQFSGKAGTGNLAFGGTVPLSLISRSIPSSPAAAGQPARFSAQLDRLQLAGGVGEHAASVAMDAKIEGEASELSLAALHATVEMSNLEVRAANTQMQQSSPTRMTISGSVARLDNLDLRGGDSSLKAAGSLGLTGSFPLRITAAGETDVAVFAALDPSIDAAGKLRLDIGVDGPLSDLKTTGYVELNQASLSVLNLPVQGSNINLRADLQGNQVTLKRLDGNLNGGTFQGGGTLTLAGNGLRGVNLFVSAKDTFSEYPASVKTISALDLKLVSRDDRLALTGKIDIVEGYTDSTLDLLSKSGSSVDTGAAPPPDTSSKPMELDLAIVTKRPVEMDNNLGRVSANANLRLGGNIKQPRLTGTLSLEEDGRLYFGDRAYDIERGTVRFLEGPRITPDLNIQASTRTGDYTIKLAITGGLSELTTTFTSDPPLSRDDVIAVLLTGKTVAENRGVDLRALEATSLATGALNASLSSQLHRTFGVSRVSIQPGAIAAESNPGARVTITQDFTRSLRLLYSMNLSDSNDQIWVGEYDLSRRFTTRAVKQKDNSYRAEFRHDVRFGGWSGTAPASAGHAAKRKISAVGFSGNGAFSQVELSKVFGVKAGQQYKAARVRKGSERLSGFFIKRGYLESRVHLDRDDEGQDIGMTVRVELGPVVEFAFGGDSLPGRTKSRLRNLWHSGISDHQRPQALQKAILGYYALQGYLRAQADVHVSGDGARKLVRVDLKPGEKYKAVQLVVEGAERLRAAEILSLVQHGPLRESTYTDPARVIEAVTAFYRQHGYLSAKVSNPLHQLDPERRTGRIVIPVQEGPLYRVGAVQFSGNQALTGADLENGLPLEAGGVFEPARLEPSLAAVKLKYGKLGYREADIEYAVTRHDDSASIDVLFRVVENRQTVIGTVKVEGNRHTDQSFARRQIRIGEGEVANTELVRDSVRNLSQTGAYASADIQVQPVAESGAGDKPIKVADLIVNVSEPRPFRLLYGGLYDSGGGPGFIADFQNHNSVGAGRVLGLRTRIDPQTDEVRLYVTQPTWRARRISTTVGTYYTRETLDYQTTPTEKLGVSLQQNVQLRSKLLLSYGYRYEKQRGFVPDPAAPDIPESVVSVAPLTLTISRDTRDSFLDATRGSFISHGFEFAPRFLGSSYPYMRYYGQIFRYFPLTTPHSVPYGEKPLRSRLVFATGTRFGLQRGFNETGAVLTDRFYSGGGTTVRGFRQDELGPKLASGQPAGGNAVLVLNEELRFPLFSFFDAVTFVDVGNVFPRVSDFRAADLRAAGGFGLRIRNPFVVLRFDYGLKFGRRPGEKVGAFFFSIGQAF